MSDMLAPGASTCTAHAHVAPPAAEALELGDAAGPRRTGDRFTWERRFRAAPDLASRRASGAVDVKHPIVMALGLLLATYTDGPTGTDPGGNAHPGAERLADELGVSASTVAAGLRALCRHGWFVKTGAGYTGQRATFALALPVATPAAVAEPTERVRTPAGSRPSTTDAADREGADTRSERVRTPAPQPSQVPTQEPFPCADRRAPAAPPSAGEGKATKQQPPDPAPLDAVARVLPEPLRRALAAPDQTGGRRTLARLLDELLADGWHLDDLVDAVVDDLPPDPTPGVLIDRARRYLDDGPPLDLDALAAAEAAEARARHLAAAAGHGRTRAALALAAGAPPLDDVDDDAARQYPHDLEARAVFVDAYRVALAEAAGADPAPARRPAAAPVDVAAARARIARIRSAALTGAAA